ncbi:hypothetical protein BH09GEM1_BH09GEM1_26240 [soil metagenome]
MSSAQTSLMLRGEAHDATDGVIGATPVVRLQRVTEPGMAEIWMKLKGANPGGSIMDRTALAMIVDAEQRGVLNAGDTIVEPTSGNTGIGLAQVASARGYCLIAGRARRDSSSACRQALLRGRHSASLASSARERGLRRSRPTRARATSRPHSSTALDGFAALPASLVPGIRPQEAVLLIALFSEDRLRASERRRR